MKNRSKTSRIRFVTALLAISLIAPRLLHAQNGINSDGTDFFVSVMPGIVHGAYFSTGSAAAYYLICSYHNNNQVWIEYIGGPGAGPWPTKQYILNRGVGREISIDPASAVPDRPGEQLQFRAAHIYSRYPISVQIYTEGSSNGSMYQAIPTAALGKNYVIAAYNDNPLKDNPGFVNRDSSSSEFLIIAPYDHTHVTYVPNSTTQSLGTIGVNSGPNSNGTTHPVTIEMQRGEVFWVRSSANDSDQDESGSTVTADKPIAVLGGQERAMIGYPNGYWTTLDNDIRDEVGEQMIPSVDWGTDYPAIPSMPASISNVTITGDGDMYRAYTNDPKGASLNYWESASISDVQNGPYFLSLYELPALEFDNVLHPIDLLTASNSTDASGNLKKFYAVQYMYFQGHHDYDPNRRIGTGKGRTPQSGGGDRTLDETTYRAENEMDLVPLDHWKTSAMFMVPANSNYSGYQFINVITYKDSLEHIRITRNGITSGTVGSFIAPLKTYQIPRHPELVGLTIKLPTGTYIINGYTPFACYSYGRTETKYKDTYGYAAPCGEAYGSHAQPFPPKVEVSPSCGQWSIRVHEAGAGGGIAEVMLLDDSDGYFVKPPQVSYNCSLIGTGTDPQDIMSPPFIVGDTSITFTVQINDPSKNAYAAVYAVDVSGNDTTIPLSYTAPSFGLSTENFRFPDTLIETQECSGVTFHVRSSGTSPYVRVLDTDWSAGMFHVTTTPPLPTQLKAGDSIEFHFCFTPADTIMHEDSITISAGCIDTTIYIGAKGLTPIIVAADHDFGNVRVGDTECAQIAVRNIGNAALILTDGSQLGNNPDYTFTGQTPDTIPPATEARLTFCFHPSRTGEDDTRMNWATNIIGIYAHHNKDTTLLVGGGLGADVSSRTSNSGLTLSIAPNPASSSVAISLAGAPSANLEIFNILGGEVASFRVDGSYQWQMGSLPAGTYIVRAVADGVVVSRRLLKK